jgi:hypothetical protein
MRDLAREAFEAVHGPGSLRQRWMRAGVDVRAVPMRGRGRCEVANDIAVVMVRQEDNEWARGFVVAHEVAHLMLSGLSNEQRGGVGYRQEEQVCDDFAREVVVPSPVLERHLNGRTMPSPEEVLRLCGVFGANPSLILAALRRQLPLNHNAYLLAKLQGHYRRPAVADFRVENAIGPRSLFWPRRTRLTSLGLSELSVAAHRAEHGSSFGGLDREVTVPRRRVHRPSGDNAAVGPVRWSAIRQGKDGPYVLALLDCSALRRARVDGASTADEDDRADENSEEAAPH